MSLLFDVDASFMATLRNVTVSKRSPGEMSVYKEYMSSRSSGVSLTVPDLSLGKSFQLLIFMLCCEKCEMTLNPDFKEVVDCYPCPLHIKFSVSLNHH